MRRSRSSGPRINQLEPLIAFRGNARAVALLALFGIVCGAGPAKSYTLEFVSKWAGEYDSDNGAKPSIGAPVPICAPFADPTIAVGTTQDPAGFPQVPIHVAADYSYGIFNKNGVPPFQEKLGSFFNNLVPNQDSVLWYSPRLLFDGPTDRFVLVSPAHTVGNNVPQQSWITIGTTATQDVFSNPSDCTYAIDANVQPNGPPTNLFPNAVRLGMTADSIVISANMVDFNSGVNQFSKLWVVRKSDIYNSPLHTCPTFSPTPPLILSGFKMPGGSNLAVHLAPAKSYDPNNSVTYLTSAWGGNGSELALWTLDTHALTLSPGLTGTSVPTKPYSSPPPSGAAQKGTTEKIALPDAEVTNAVYQPDAGLWTVHAVTCPWDSTLSCFKWYQIDPLAGKAIQDGIFGYNSSVAVSSYAPSVAVNQHGNAVFVFNASGPQNYPSVYYAGRDGVTTPINQLQGSGFVLVNGVAPFDRPTGVNGLGLTTSIDADPVNDQLFWMMGAYASGTPTFDNSPLACKGSGQVVDSWTTEVGGVASSQPEPGAVPHDFNGDEVSDILLESDSGEAVIWEMKGASAIGGGSAGIAGSSWHIKGSGDFSRRGFSDILWQSDTGNIAIWQMHGTQVIGGGPAPNPGAAWHVKATGDFNGDGFSDILLQHDTGDVAIWEMNGTVVIGGGVVGRPGAGWHAIATSDFNNDGYSDILLQHDNGDVAIWEIKGTQVIGGGLVGSPGAAWHVRATGDFNGDGFSDILLQHDNGDVAIWEMNGASAIGGGVVGSPGASWRALRTGYFNVDPNSDIVFQNSSTGDVAIWFIRGTTIVGGGNVGSPGRSWHVAAP
jgi:hypothetical protein